MTTPTGSNPAALRSALSAIITVDAEVLKSTIGSLFVEMTVPSPGVRSSYDPEKKATILYSSSIYAGQEANAVVDELLRWHGARALPADWAEDLAAEVKGWAAGEPASFEREVHDAVMAYPNAADRAEALVARAAFEATRRDCHQAPRSPLNGWRERLQGLIDRACEATFGSAIDSPGSERFVSMTRALAGESYEPMMGRLWWTADDLAEARSMVDEYTAKGASVEVGEGDSAISVFITIDRALAMHAFGYQPGEEEWMLEGEENTSPPVNGPEQKSTPAPRQAADDLAPM